MTPEQQREAAAKVATSALGDLDTFDIAELVAEADDADLDEILRLVQVATVTIVDPAEPHIIDLRRDGWTIQHPMACRLAGQLFDCALNRQAEQLAAPPDYPGPGRYECHLDDDGELVIGDPITSAGDGEEPTGCGCGTQGCPRCDYV